MTDKATPPVHAIVLAAGASTRFGSPKQYARLGGKTLLQRAINAATEAVGPALRVVLGAHAENIATMLDLQADQTVVNTHWARGMAGSIRLGVQSLPGDCPGALVLLADQPYVTGASLARLINVWLTATDHIVASSYGTVIGAPCLFPRWCFTDMELLDGDQGARSVMARHRAHVLAVEHPEAAIDIDTPQQLCEQLRLV